MLPSLQVIRAAAALAVLAFHFGAAVGVDKYFGFTQLLAITWFGKEGVLLFFVLSGFIIHHVHARDIGRPERLGVYLWRRIVRLYPAYLVVLAGMAVSLAVISGTGALPKDPMVILRTILLLPQNRAVVGGTGAPVVIVAWSLQYEMLFYALFGLLILNRWLGIVAIVGMALAMVVGRLSGETGYFPAYLSLTYLTLFGIGAATSWLHRQPWVERFAATGLRVAMVLTGLVWLVSVLDAEGGRSQVALYHSPQGMFGLALLSALLIGSAAVCDRLALAKGQTESAPGLWHRAWQYLGAISYAMYLVHYPVVSLACKVAVRLGFDGGTGVALAGLASFTGTVVLAALLHEFVEKPILKAARPITAKSA